MSATDLVLIVLIFGEFFLFLAIANYFERRGEKYRKTETKDFPFYEGALDKKQVGLHYLS